MNKTILKNIIAFSLILFFVQMGGFAQYIIASQGVTGKKTTTITSWAPGYVMDLNGQKKEGKIQLKIVNSDTVQVKLKGDAGKETFERLDIQYFGLLLQEDYFDKFKDHRKNFQKGYIIDNAGKKTEGRLAMRYDDDLTGRLVQQMSPDKWKIHVILFEGSDTYIKDYWPEQLKEVGQVDESGKVVKFERIQTVWSELLIEEGKYQLLRNPFSAVVDKKKTRMASAFGSQMSSGVSNTAASNGVSVTETSSGSGVVYAEEYLVRKNGEEKGKLVSEKNYEEWIGSELSSCAAYKGLTKKEAKKLNDWKNFQALVNWANKNCK